MTTPYIGFGNDTLAQCQDLKAGDEINCPRCGQKHKVEDSVPPMLLWYRCGGITYIAGLRWMLVADEETEKRHRAEAELRHAVAERDALRAALRVRLAEEIIDALRLVRGRR